RPLPAVLRFLTAPCVMRLGRTLGRVALVSILDRATPGLTAALLHSRLLPGWMFAWTPMADPALLAFFVAAGLLAAGQLLAPTQTGRSFAWAMLPAFLGLSAVRPGNARFSSLHLS